MPPSKLRGVLSLTTCASCGHESAPDGPSMRKVRGKP